MNLPKEDYVRIRKVHLAIAKRLCDGVPPGSKRHWEWSCCGDAIDHNLAKSFLALEGRITAIFKLMEMESRIERKGLVPVAMEITEKAGNVVGICMTESDVRHKRVPSGMRKLRCRKRKDVAKWKRR